MKYISVYHNLYHGLHSNNCYVVFHLPIIWRGTIIYLVCTIYSTRSVVNSLAGWMYETIIFAWTPSTFAMFLPELSPTGCIHKVQAAFSFPTTIRCSALCSDELLICFNRYCIRCPLKTDSFCL